MQEEVCGLRYPTFAFHSGRSKAKGPPPPIKTPPVVVAPPPRAPPAVVASPPQPAFVVTVPVGANGGQMWVPNAWEPPQCPPPPMHSVRGTPIRDNVELLEHRFFDKHASAYLKQARQNWIFNESLLD